jgi:cytidine deaminase
MVRSELAELDRLLLEAAEAIRKNAHAPYSGYFVGAAARAASGRVYTGCNVEVSSFSQTCCAERVAVFSAISAGETRIVAVAVVTDDAPPASPCGACRQVLHDFGADMSVLLGNLAGEVRVHALRSLLPEGFEPSRVLRVMGQRGPTG